MTVPAIKPDLQFYNVGSFVLCSPETEAGEDWIAEHIGDDTRPLPIEHRFVEDIVHGARNDGLVCHG